MDLVESRSAKWIGPRYNFPMNPLNTSLHKFLEKFVVLRSHKNGARSGVYRAWSGGSNSKNSITYESYCRERSMEME